MNTNEKLPFTIKAFSEIGKYPFSTNLFLSPQMYDDEVVRQALLLYPGEDLTKRIWVELPADESANNWNRCFQKAVRERTEDEVKKILLINTLWVIDQYFVFGETVSNTDIRMFKDTFTFFINIFREYIENGAVSFAKDRSTNNVNYYSHIEIFGASIY